MSVRYKRPAAKKWLSSFDGLTLAPLLIHKLVKNSEVGVAKALDTVWVAVDGSVACSTCDNPYGEDIGRLLDAMWPRTGTTRVPGAIRFTITWVLLEIDVPLFASLAKLPTTLARHERRDHSVGLRALSRGAAPPAARGG
jgi:hypothetical protein